MMEPLPPSPCHWRTCFTGRLMDALFFSDSVYGRTPDAVIKGLEMKIGKVEPLMDHGFDDDGKQVIFMGRSSSGNIIVACRGTASLGDVLQDFKFLLARLPFVRGAAAAAHWGFSERAQSVPIDLFCKLLEAGEDIVFTGHSLGGAVASLLCLRVLEESSKIAGAGTSTSSGSHSSGRRKHVQCITFGSPLFANSHLADLVNSKYKDVFVHVVSKKDFIPRILPICSTVRNLLFGEDYLQGLQVLRKGLDYMEWLPLGSALGAIERRVPSIFKFAFRCFLKLVLPSEFTGSYAFAGHVWMLDTVGGGSKEQKSPYPMSNGDDMNLWHSQLNFALGVSFSASITENHSISTYYKGIVQTLTQILSSGCDDGGCSNGGICAKKSVGTSSLYVRALLLDGMDVCQKDALYEAQKSPGDLHSLEHVSSCKVVEKGVGLEASKLGSSKTKVVSSGKRLIKQLGCCSAALRLFTPFSWEALSSGAHVQDDKHAVLLTRLAADSIDSHCGRRLLSINSPLPLPLAQSLSKPMITHSHSGFLSEWLPGNNCRKGEEGGSSLQHFDIIGTTCEVKNVFTVKNGQLRPRRYFGFVSVIGTVGRIARHLCALDNLCLVTFAGIVFSNLHI